MDSLKETHTLYIQIRDVSIVVEINVNKPIQKLFKRPSNSLKLFDAIFS